MGTPEEHKAASRVGKVELTKVKVDPTYQRTPSPTLADEIEQGWDPVSAGILLVSDRGERDPESGVEGGMFLVDGQHRAIGARRKGIRYLDARIIDMTDEADPAAVEARYRLTTNVGLRDRATERFKAQIRAGDAESVHIVKILAQEDTFILFNPADEGGLTCISTIEQIYRVDGVGALLSNTLALTKEAFGSFQDKAGTSSMLKAMAWFLAANYEDSDHRRLIEKLKEIQSAAIDRRARTIQGTMSGSLWFNYYRAIVDVYNERLTDNRRLEWISRGAKTLGGKARQAGT